MNALFLLVGLLAGNVSAEELERHVVDRGQAAVYAQATDARSMTNEQINQVYLTPEGWDPAEWADAVRSINLNVPAGRR